MADLGDRGIDFLGGQLTAFPGFGPLRHFNLDFRCMDQVVACDAETAGSDLFNGAVLRVSVGHRYVSFCVFPAFARVAFPTQTIHGDGETFMRFFTQRAIGHRPGLEFLDDVRHGFHFLDGDGIRAFDVEIKQLTQGKERIPVDFLTEFLEAPIIPFQARFLQKIDRFRIIEMEFAALFALV